MNLPIGKWIAKIIRTLAPHGKILRACISILDFSPQFKQWLLSRLLEFESKQPPIQYLTASSERWLKTIVSKSEND